MIVYSLISVGIAAIFGAWLRFFFALFFNPIFPIIPLGTLISNLIGGFLMGMFMAFTKNHAYLSENIRLAIATGFLGSLTTFSTFSAETVNLLTSQQYFWAVILILGHVIGTILATILGIFFINFLHNI